MKNISYKEKVFVHRDFHISNIMITPNGLGLIDNQDAVYGNIAYDLASLIDDVRFKTNMKIKIYFNEFIKKIKVLIVKNLNKILKYYQFSEILK